MVTKATIWLIIVQMLLHASKQLFANQSSVLDWKKAAERCLDVTDLARLSLLTFLHDVGKLHPGFQAKAVKKEQWRINRHGHLSEGAAIYGKNNAGEDIAKYLHLDALCKWGVSNDLLYSVISHHGRPLKFSDRGSKEWEKTSFYDPVVEAQKIGEVLFSWFPEAFADSETPLPDRTQFQHLLCGFVTLADWLGSDRNFFKFVPELDPAYMTNARKKANEAVASIGLDVGKPRLAISRHADFHRVSGHGSPHPVQQSVASLSLEEQIVILEAETGSGKTEAGLWHFARLFESGKVDGLYFALPTRAAAKQIHGRVVKAADRLFGNDAPQTVLAVPGFIRAGSANAKALPHWKVRWDDDWVDEKQLRARWAAESSKRFLAAAIAVGTVDQAMLAALQVKHAHLRAASLVRSLLIIDEVHASDPYMTEIIHHLLSIHVANGGYVLLMSATLGVEARQRWLTKKDEATLAEAKIIPYPAIWSEKTEEPITAEAGKEQKHVLPELMTWTPSDVAGRAIEAAKNGARVLIIRNTVQYAVDTYDAVLDAGGKDHLWQVKGKVALHHSRFAPEDRELLDDSVEEALSPNQMGTGGVIVIGTQTLEQSLDIDADFLLTDLCPMDILLQRIGRLHRHKRERPKGYEAPVCVVMTPEGGLAQLATPQFENGLGSFKDGGGVYTNLHACELTRRLVEKYQQWIIPEMNRLLVESAIHQEAIEQLNDELGQPWKEYWNTIIGLVMAEAGAGKGHRLRVDASFFDDHNVLFPSSDEAIRTRLGAEGAAISFAKPDVIGPFGVPVSGITLPAHKSKAIHEPVMVEPEVENGMIKFEIEGQDFQYGIRGLQW